MSEHEVLTPEVLPPEADYEPSWERAREYCQNIKKSVEDIVLLGRELLALKMQWFDVGGRPEKNSGHPVPSFPSNDPARGWQKRVRDELGISRKTAERIIERAETITMIGRLKEGNPVRYWLNGKKGEERVIEPTPEVIAMADEALTQIEVGTISAPRAWAGLVGESSRRGQQGGVSHRAPVDHGKNIMRAIAMLKNSIRHWKRLNPEVRSKIEMMWAEVSEDLPETWQWK